MKKELDVVAALIEEDGKYLLCQRKKEDRYGSLWEFPGGCLESNESFRQGIEREILEELGLEVTAGNFVGPFYDEDQTLIIKVYLFTCTISGGRPQALECKNFGFFSLDEMAQLDIAPVDRKIFYYLKTQKE